ncbi:MAG: N-acetylmuramic acid 6-phosphate etherase [Candidatus Melainabacteria bacterium]
MTHATPPPASILDGIIPTEQVNPRTTDIDQMDSVRLMETINAEDALVAAAVAKAIPAIATVVDRIAAGFQNGGRLLYFGAGTSGRLGVLDASECPPTFGADPEQVQGVIAGGDIALRNAVEGAEDDEAAGSMDCLALKPTQHDVIVGLSASGHAPYVTGVVNAARSAGAYTAAITCHGGSALAALVDQAIVVAVGPEVVAGSTRMKAGTAQKLVLNMLSTGAMIQTGKTMGNLMVDVQPTNGKLKIRARRLVAQLGGVSETEAEAFLSQTAHQVKPAVLMARFRLSAAEAEKALKSAGGKLKAALKQPESNQ